MPLETHTPTLTPEETARIEAETRDMLSLETPPPPTPPPPALHALPPPQPLHPEGSPPLTLADLTHCLVTSEELCSLAVPKRPRLIGQWLCTGDLGFVFAPRGVGKTWLSMALPHAVASGLPLGEWTAGEQRAKVLYIDGEMPLELSKQRHLGLHHPGGDVAYLHHDLLFERLERSLNIALPTHQQAITDLLQSTGRDFLILDNLSCLATGVDENKAISYERISSWLLELRRRKITVLFVHHAGREGFMRGSTKREDAASWIIELRDARDPSDTGAKFITHFAKPSRNTADPTPDLLWHFTTTPDSDRTTIHCEATSEAPMETMLRLIGEGKDTNAALASHMKQLPCTISRWVKKGVAEGKIRKTGNKLSLIAPGPI